MKMNHLRGLLLLATVLLVGEMKPITRREQAIKDSKEAVRLYQESRGNEAQQLEAQQLMDKLVKTPLGEYWANIAAQKTKGALQPSDPTKKIAIDEEPGHAIVIQGERKGLELNNQVNVTTIKNTIHTLKLPTNDTALLIIDVQNDFMYAGDGSLPVPDTQDNYVMGCNDIAAFMKKKGYLVVASQDYHPKGHISFASTHGKTPFETKKIEITLVDGRTKKIIAQTMWPDHCVQDTNGAQVRVSNEYIDATYQKGVDKGDESYSAFKGETGKETGLKRYLNNKGIKNLVVYGIATDVCVLYTVRDAIKAGFNVYVVERLCRGVDKFNSWAALQEMMNLGAKIIDADGEIISNEGATSTTPAKPDEEGLTAEQNKRWDSFNNNYLIFYPGVEVTDIVKKYDLNLEDAAGREVKYTGKTGWLWGQGEKINYVFEAQDKKSGDTIFFVMNSDFINTLDQNDFRVITEPDLKNKAQVNGITYPTDVKKLDLAVFATHGKLDQYKDRYSEASALPAPADVTAGDIGGGMGDGGSPEASDIPALTPEQLKNIRAASINENLSSWLNEFVVFQQASKSGSDFKIIEQTVKTPEDGFEVVVGDKKYYVVDVKIKSGFEKGVKTRLSHYIIVDERGQYLRHVEPFEGASQLRDEELYQKAVERSGLL